MKVLDVIEECQSKPREAPKENTPACGNFLTISTPRVTILKIT